MPATGVEVAERQTFISPLVMTTTYIGTYLGSMMCLLCTRGIGNQQVPTPTALHLDPIPPPHLHPILCLQYAPNAYVRNTAFGGRFLGFGFVECYPPTQNK